MWHCSILSQKVEWDLIVISRSCSSPTMIITSLRYLLKTMALASSAILSNVLCTVPVQQINLMKRISFLTNSLYDLPVLLRSTLFLICWIDLITYSTSVKSVISGILCSVRLVLLRPLMASSIGTVREIVLSFFVLASLSSTIPKKSGLKKSMKCLALSLFPFTFFTGVLGHCISNLLLEFKVIYLCS